MYKCLFRIAFFCYLTLIASRVFAFEIPVLVDGKQAALLDPKILGTEFNLTREKISNVPPSDQWMYVRIDANKGNHLQFPDWRNKFHGKQILIRQSGAVTQLGLYRNGNDNPLYTMHNPSRISIYTQMPQPNAVNENQQIIESPNYLKLKYKDLEFKVSNRKLERASVGREQEVFTSIGWSLSYVIDSLGIKPDYKTISLGCHNNSKPMVLSIKDAAHTYLKLNKHNKWRAIKAETLKGSKQAWERCHSMDRIEVS